MRVIGNILWVIFGGALLSLMWCIAGFICVCTVILMPVGFQCFKFAKFILWPFGKDIMFSTSTGSFLLNILWIMLFGWELAIASLIVGMIWCVTIIGIPFGMRCFKFAKLALLPFGSSVIRVY